MSDSMGLVKVNFHGQDIDCVKNKEGVWVLHRRLCENIGVDAKSQRDKLQNKSWARGVLITSRDSAGKLQEQYMLHLDSVPMWLATIDAERVAEEARPKIELYQKECAQALRDYWFAGEAVRHEAPKRAQRPSILSITRGRLAVIEAMAAAVASVPGMQPDGVAVLKLNAIGSAFDVDPEPFRRALPSRTPKATLNPTQVGELLEISAREANRRLLAAGLQQKNAAGDWELTEKGQAFGESFRFQRNGHDGFEIRWMPEAADAINNVAPLEVLPS